MTNTADIPFRKIPNQSKLFLDYLDFSPEALKFLGYRPTIESLVTVAGKIRDVQFPRNEVASILRKQNLQYGCDDLTLSNIDMLKDSDCVAIVTGQQVGLFTGPLYTVYKALSAIHLAAELSRQGIKAVPIFWMDTEDHDLPEVTQRTIINPDSTLDMIDYRDILGMGMTSRPVGSIEFPEQILMAVEDYLAHLPDDAGKPALRRQLEVACRPGTTFAHSFARLLFSILPGLGLILFDPHDTHAKQLTSSVFQTAIRDEQAFRSALLEKNTRLENAGYHAQVSVLENSTVLFFIENGERRALERRGTRFGLKSTGRTFELSELLQYAIESPDKFSPNVLLRPIIQDHLFPTVAYVGGSSEVAYFAQIETLYSIYGRPMPVVWPRNSFTLVETEVAAAMDKLGIGIEDCFDGKKSFIEKVVRRSELSSAATSLDELNERMDRILTEVKPELEKVEPPLAQALETARRKIMHNLQHLKTQVIQFERKRNSSIESIVELLFNHSFPNEKLQERELSIFNFLVRRGPSVIDAICSAMDVCCLMHRVIRL